MRELLPVDQNKIDEIAEKYKNGEMLYPELISKLNELNLSADEHLQLLISIAELIEG
jgi:hypothetical protein